MKKLLLIALLLAFVVFAFTACDRNGGSTGTSGQGQSAGQGAGQTERVTAPIGTRAEILASLENWPAPTGYIINATQTRPDANMLHSTWNNPTPNGRARDLMFTGLNTMSRNQNNEFFPNPLVMVGGAWPVITDDADGNRTYTFTIYTDNLFSDGTPITAHHYAGHFAFLTSSQWHGATPGATDWLQLLHRGPWVSGESATLPSVRIYSDSQFSVTFAAQFIPNVWEAATNMNIQAWPLHMFGVEVHDNGDGVFLTAIGGGEFTEAALRAVLYGGTENVYLVDANGNYIYNAEGVRQSMEIGDGLKFRPTVVPGPYMFESVDVGNGVLTLVANPNFPGTWDGYRPRIERVIWRLTPLPLMVDAIASGAAHMTDNAADGGVLETGIELLVGGGTHQAIVYPQLGMLFTQFHTDTGPAQFVEVRQALSFLQDRHAMNEEAGRGFTAVLHGPWTTAWWWYQEAANRDLYDRITFYDFNIPRAIELLEQGGWNYNADGSPFVQGVDELRHKWVDEWEYGRDADGNIVRLVEEGGIAVRCNRVYTGERVLMPLIINWMVRAIDYPFRDALERTFPDNVAYVGGLVIQERSDLWSNALNIAGAFAGQFDSPRWEMHTLGMNFGTTWAPWQQAALENIPGQNWGQHDSPEWRRLADNIRMQDITTEAGRDGFIEAFIAYMEWRTYNALTIPFNTSLSHDFIPVNLGNWSNTSVWQFDQAVQRAYWR